MEKYSIQNVHNDFDGYSQLIDFYNEFKGEILENIELKIENWFDANLCSVLGAIIDNFNQDFNTVSFNLTDSIQKILQKNSFLAQFGYANLIDTYHTTIKYLKLKPTDGRFFSNYVETELLNRSEFPTMSDAVHERISLSINEMFINAQIHSETNYIFTCGQFFPRDNKLTFTIVDTGIGFSKRITKNLNFEISSIDAIRWAIENGNTTKKDVSGGIGLALLKEFISQNNGRIQIISGDAFYELFNGQESITKLNSSFDGSIINMIFKTDDATSYILQEELDDNDIF